MVRLFPTLLLVVLSFTGARPAFADSTGSIVDAIGLTQVAQRLSAARLTVLANRRERLQATVDKLDRQPSLGPLQRLRQSFAKERLKNLTEKISLEEQQIQAFANAMSSNLKAAGARQDSESGPAPSAKGVPAPSPATGDVAAVMKPQDNPQVVNLTNVSLSKLIAARSQGE